MTLFILGVLLGAGLILAAQELQFLYYLRKENHLRIAQDNAIAVVECTCWGAPNVVGQHAYYCPVA